MVFLFGGVNMIRRLIESILAALALSFLAAPLCAVAQPQAVAGPRISGFDVEPVTQPTAGSELFFTLYGSPGGTARVQISGGGSLLLEEVEPGVYEGSYTIRQRDRIGADSAATVNLRLGNRVATGVLDESLVAGGWKPRSIAAPVPVAPVPPKIERFEVAQVDRLAPPADLSFTLQGTPDGTATVRIAGLPGKLMLEEVQRGVYRGAYDIRGRDRIAPDAVVTANLRVGTQESSRVLDRPLLLSSARPPVVRAKETCSNCGVVETINAIEVKGDGSYVGKIAGGVVGALIGSQIGQGSGRTAAQIAGAVGGAVAGNEIEKRTKTTTHYEVVVRLPNGGTQTISYPNPPPFAVGAKVRVESGELRAL